MLRQGLRFCSLHPFTTIHLSAGRLRSKSPCGKWRKRRHKKNTVKPLLLSTTAATTETAPTISLHPNTITRYAQDVLLPCKLLSPNCVSRKWQILELASKGSLPLAHTQQHTQTCTHSYKKFHSFYANGSANERKLYQWTGAFVERLKKTYVLMHEYVGECAGGMESFNRAIIARTMCLKFVNSRSFVLFFGVFLSR